MKVTCTSSKWGNLYRFRYYVDGERVTNSEGESILGNMTQSQKDECHTSARTEYGYKDEWNF